MSYCSIKILCVLSPAFFLASSSLVLSYLSLPWLTLGLIFTVHWTCRVPSGTSMPLLMLSPQPERKILHALWRQEWCLIQECPWDIEQSQIYNAISINVNGVGLTNEWMNEWLYCFIHLLNFSLFFLKGLNPTIASFRQSYLILYVEINCSYP